MKKRVLVVDDDPSVVAMMKIIFDAYGYTATVARSASEARTVLGDEHFDVVVTDMKMESSTAGFEVARAARMEPYQPVVVILTAFPVLPEAWREAGADAVVTKPADIRKLVEMVEDLLAKRGDSNR